MLHRSEIDLTPDGWVVSRRQGSMLEAVVLGVLLGLAASCVLVIIS